MGSSLWLLEASLVTPYGVSCQEARGILGFPVAQLLKNPPAIQQTQVQSLGWEDLLEKEIATHSSILTWRIPWTEEPSEFTVHGVTTEQLTLSLFTS